jgi:glycogen(starch) synthase
MIERLLVDDGLRERLVAEASEHVLRFDWDDIALRTLELYGELAGAAAREEGVPRR